MDWYHHGRGNWSAASIEAVTARPVRSALASAFALASLFLVAARGADADDLQRLSGSQIASRFTGHMLTDDAHWRESYKSGGIMVAEQMGGPSMTGSWRVHADTLCSVLPGIRDECYAVWIAGQRVELRHPSYEPVSAFLRPTRPKSQ